MLDRGNGNMSYDHKHVKTVAAVRTSDNMFKILWQEYLHGGKFEKKKD